MVTVVGPLSFSRKLDSLKYTSVIALFAVAYLCLIVVWHFVIPNFPTAPPEEIELVHFSTKFFTSLPVFVFAFTCHQNVSLARGLQHIMGKGSGLDDSLTYFIINRYSPSTTNKGTTVKRKLIRSLLPLSVLLSSCMKVLQLWATSVLVKLSWETSF